MNRDDTPRRYAQARPDPLAGVEARVLQHPDRDHPEVLDLLVARIPAGDLGRATSSATWVWTASATGCGSSVRPAGATCACPSRGR